MLPPQPHVSPDQNRSVTSTHPPKIRCRRRRFLSSVDNKQSQATRSNLPEHRKTHYPLLLSYTLVLIEHHRRRANVPSRVYDSTATAPSANPDKIYPTSANMLMASKTDRAPLPPSEKDATLDIPNSAPLSGPTPRTVTPPPSSSRSSRSAPSLADVLHVDEQSVRRSTRPKVVGHRGALYQALENTRESFRLCSAMGCDFVELDVFQVSFRQFVLVLEQSRISRSPQ